MVSKISLCALPPALLLCSLPLTAFDQAGVLDPTFGTGGIVIHDFSSDIDEGDELVFQSDGKILVGGRYYDGTSNNYAVYRFNTDGSVDLTFDGDGFADVDLLNADYCYDIALQADGKIVLSGATELTPASGNKCVGVVRLNADGSLDNTFDSDGIVITDVPAFSTLGMDVEIQADGKIVVLAAAYDGSEYDVCILRYNTDGSSDITFDTDGWSIADIGPFWEEAGSLALQDDGKIVVVGTCASNPDSSYDILVERFNIDGSLDNTFDGDGYVWTDFVVDPEQATGVAIQPDGKILIGTSITLASIPYVSVVRYNGDGSVDLTFDSDGYASIITPGASTQPLDIALQDDGRIVLTGTYYEGTDFDFFVARFDWDGSVDMTFGTDGMAVTDLSGATDEEVAYAVGVQPDGKIVAVGYWYNVSSNLQFAMARYGGGPSTQDVFEEDQTSLRIYPNPSSGQVTVQADGDGSIRIVNAIGQLVFEEVIHGSGTYALEAKGIYFATVTTGGDSVTERIVVE